MPYTPQDSLPFSATMNSETENPTPAIPPNTHFRTVVCPGVKFEVKRYYAAEVLDDTQEKPKPANPFTLFSAFESLVYQMNGAPVRHSYGGRSYSIVVLEQHREWFNEILKAVKTVNALSEEIARLDGREA